MTFTPRRKRAVHPKVPLWTFQIARHSVPCTILKQMICVNWLESGVRKALVLAEGGPHGQALMILMLGMRQLQQSCCAPISLLGCTGGSRWCSRTPQSCIHGRKATGSETGQRLVLAHMQHSSAQRPLAIHLARAVPVAGTAGAGRCSTTSMRLGSDDVICTI